MDSHIQREAYSESSFELNLQHLKDLQKAYEAQEKYSEAEKIEEKIQKLKEKQRKKEVSKLKCKQRSERHSIDSIYRTELKQFNTKWEVSLKTCIDKFKVQEDELLNKHEFLYSTEKESLEKNAPCFFKPSGQLLNVIKGREKAVMAKKYKDAQILTDEIDKVLEYEKEHFNEKRQLKINKQLAILQKKLDKEVEVLRSKQETEFRELKKIRDFERENMEKKIENLCRGLENAQNIEVNIAKGLHTTNAGRRSPQRPSSSYRSELSTPLKLVTHKKSLKT